MKICNNYLYAQLSFGFFNIVRLQEQNISDFYLYIFVSNDGKIVTDYHVYSCAKLRFCLADGLVAENTVPFHKNFTDLRNIFQL